MSVLHPEEVDTCPWAEDDTLPAPLTDLMDSWDDAQAAEDGPGAPSYPGDLAVPPGWRVGCFPSWASTGPMAVGCASCATPMRSESGNNRFCTASFHGHRTDT